MVSVSRSSLLASSTRVNYVTQKQLCFVSFHLRRR